jgi:hypothetical protein
MKTQNTRNENPETSENHALMNYVDEHSLRAVALLPFGVTKYFLCHP